MIVNGLEALSVWQPHPSHPEYPKWFAMVQATARLVQDADGAWVVRYTYHDATRHDTHEEALAAFRTRQAAHVRPDMPALYAEARRRNARRGA